MFFNFDLKSFCCEKMLFFVVWAPRTGVGYLVRLGVAVCNRGRVRYWWPLESKVAGWVKGKAWYSVAAAAGPRKKTLTAFGMSPEAACLVLVSIIICIFPNNRAVFLKYPVFYSPEFYLVCSAGVVCSPSLL
jgi:hypothetical protein